MVPIVKPRTEHELFVKNRCVNILREFGKNSKLFDQELAKFVATHMANDYAHIEFNMEKPAFLVEYDVLSEKDKMEWNRKYPEWRDRDDIQLYFRTKHSIEAENASNKSFIQTCINALDGTGHAMEQDKLKSILGEHPSARVGVEKVDWDS